MILHHLASVVFSFLLTGCWCNTEVASYDREWSYDHSLGPSKWPRIFAKCKGSRQSPVHIRTSMVHINHTLGRIFLRAFRKRQLYRIENIGATVVVTLLPGQLTPKLEQANSRDVYIFHNLHFHWMSEHVINSVRYALEGHFVLYNIKYADMEAAREHSDGIEVISALFLVRMLPNRKLWPLLNGVRHVVGIQQSINITMALDDILPAHISAYFRYPGSLTTPPCDEAVTWTLLYPPSYIGIQQLDLCRRLHRQLSGGTADWTRLDNTRPVQPLNRRDLYH